MSITVQAIVRGTVSGKVCDIVSSRVLRGALVEILSGSKVVFRTNTAANGFFWATGLPRGSYILRVALQDYCPVELPVQVRGYILEQTEVLLQPMAPSGMKGLVKDALNGKPLPAQITLKGVESICASADVDGRFFLAPLKPAVYSLVLATPGYHQASVSCITLSPGIFVEVVMELWPKGGGMGVG